MKNLTYARKKIDVFICSTELYRKLSERAKEAISTKMHKKRLSNLQGQCCCQAIILIVTNG